jgi:hypothetical protein
MPAVPLPVAAAWQHRDARQGFEVVYFRTADDGYRVDGCTTAVEDGEPWVVEYAIHVDATWTTRGARVIARWPAGTRRIEVEADGRGGWRVDGVPAPHLDGCLDLDLESSSMTNAFPVRRMALGVGDKASAPAAYVRALDLSVERLEQEYVRVADDGVTQRYDYSAPAFEFSCRLVYDLAGLALDYPGIAVRAL